MAAGTCNLEDKLERWRPFIDLSARQKDKGTRLSSGTERDVSLTFATQNTEEKHKQKLYKLL